MTVQARANESTPLPDEWDPARQFIIDELARTGERLKALCRRLDLPYVSISQFLKHQQNLSPFTVARLRAAFKLRLPQMPGEAPDLVTPEEAAEILGVVRRTIWRLKRDGMLIAIGKGKSIRYSREAVEALRDRRSAASPREATAADRGKLDEPSEAAVPPQTCACSPDCEAPVLTPGRTYARGHYPRTPGEVRRPQQPPKVSRCAACGADFTHRAGRTRMYCSKRCFGATRIETRALRDAFEQFIYNRWQESGLSMQACSRRWKLGGNAVARMLDGEFPTDNTLATLREQFGETLPDPTPRNGFTSETERRRAQAASHQAAEIRPHEYSRDPAARRKNSEAGRGRVKSPETVEKWRTTIQGEDTGQTWREGQGRARARTSSVQARAESSLTRFLRNWTRRGGVGPPSTERLERHAQQLLSHFRRNGIEITDEKLAAIWRPILVKYGIVPPIGRPPADDDTRCKIVAAEYRLLSIAKRRHVGRDFWPRVATLVSEVEGVAITVKTMKAWKSSHDERHSGCELRGLIPMRQAVK